MKNTNKLQGGCGILEINQSLSNDRIGILFQILTHIVLLSIWKSTKLPIWFHFLFDTLQLSKDLKVHK